MTETPIAPPPAPPTPAEPHRPASLPRPPAPALMQASSDEPLITLWLHGRSPATRRAYTADVERSGGLRARRDA